MGQGTGVLDFSAGPQLTPNRAPLHTADDNSSIRHRQSHSNEGFISPAVIIIMLELDGTPTVAIIDYAAVIRNTRDVISRKSDAQKRQTLQPSSDRSY